MTGNDRQALNPRVLFNLEILGERYFQRYLKAWSDISVNWWTALSFFFERAFMRGRRDALSEQYYRSAIRSLRLYFGIKEKPAEEDFERISGHHEEFQRSLEDIDKFKKGSGRKQTENSIMLPGFHEKIALKNPLINELLSNSNSKGQRPIHNDKDLIMIISALIFLTREGIPANIYNYMAGQLKEGNADKLARELQEIRFVGDKIASFILRDVVLLNPQLAVANARLVFPVDTWVLNIAQRFGCKSKDPCDVRDFFISQIKGYSAAKVAAGLWHLGFNSLEILLANLDRIDVMFWKE